MSQPPAREYPPHHPWYGRTLIEVHDHDVLCGRGVNISQHPGNERFRALVKTRMDESYCTGFTTSEKRALAEEIVGHIRSLDPPGRFLKRLGRSQSSRGLAGPWEELSQRECVKKACQALRDCNRQDRTGYAATVKAPTDVAANAEERAKSGLSLKEHAAAAAAVAAKENPNPLYSLDLPKNHGSGRGSADFDLNTIDPNTRRAAQAISQKNAIGRQESMSPSVGLAAHWLKKQRTEDTHPDDTGDREHSLPAEPVLSHNQNQSTPAPYIAPIPVTATPAPAQAYTHDHNGHMPHSEYHLSLAQNTNSPCNQFSMASAFHEHSATAIYSPVVLLHEQDDPHGVESNADIDHHAFDDHNPFDTGHHDDHNDDVLKTAAAAAASSMGHHLHHRNNSLTLGDEDDHGTLNISDFQDMGA